MSAPEDVRCARCNGFLGVVGPPVELLRSPAAFARQLMVLPDDEMTIATYSIGTYIAPSLSPAPPALDQSYAQQIDSWVVNLASLYPTPFLQLFEDVEAAGEGEGEAEEEGAAAAREVDGEGESEAGAAVFLRPDDDDDEPTLAPPAVAANEESGGDEVDCATTEVSCAEGPGQVGGALWPSLLRFLHRPSLPRPQPPFLPYHPS